MNDLLKAQNEALDALRTLKIQVEGAAQDQYLTSEWQPMTLAGEREDIWIRHVAPRLGKGHFSISCVHALQGVHLKNIVLEQDVLFMCASGALLINGLRFDAGYTTVIPAGTNHSFLALEECYTVVNFLYKEPLTIMNVA